MAHDTTELTHVRQGVPRPPRAAGDHGGPTGQLGLAVDGQPCRVRTAWGSTQWLPDTPSKRHLTLVGCRLLGDAHGTPLFTLQACATRVGRTHRQAASQHREDCRQCGADMRAFVLRKRQGAAAVVAGVVSELLQTPWAGPTALVPRVKARLGRQDLPVAHLEGALEQLACVPVLRTLRRQGEAGHVQQQETARLRAILESLSAPADLYASLGVPRADRGMRLADPTALAALVPPDLPRAPVPGSLGWLPLLRTLCQWTVPCSVLGRWCGVHKTTIGRWVCGVAVAVWPLVSQWMREHGKAHLVYVDAQWRTIHGRWHSWCVVLAVAPDLPVLAVLLPSRGQWACRWVGRPVRQRKHVPKGLSTDGLQAYASLVPGAKHVWCRLHHQQGVTHW